MPVSRMKMRPNGLVAGTHPLGQPVEPIGRGIPRFICSSPVRPDRSWQRQLLPGLPRRLLNSSINSATVRCLLLFRLVPRPERHPLDQFPQQRVDRQHLHRLAARGPAGNRGDGRPPHRASTRWAVPAGNQAARVSAAASRPDRPAPWSCSRIGRAAAGGAGVDGGPVVPAEAAAIPSLYGQLVRIKKVIGKNKGHMSDFCCL